MHIQLNSFYNFHWQPEPVVHPNTMEEGTRAPAHLQDSDTVFIGGGSKMVGKIGDNKSASWVTTGGGLLLLDLC